MSASVHGRPEPDSTRSTALNGLIGGLVGLFLSFVPFSPLFGGLVAGYLDGRDVGDGLVAGLIAGIVYGLATLFLFVAFGSIVFGLVGGAAPPGLAVGGFLVVATIGVVYLVGFAVVGGALGSYLNAEFGDDIGRL